MGGRGRFLEPSSTTDLKDPRGPVFGQHVAKVQDACGVRTGDGLEHPFPTQGHPQVHLLAAHLQGLAVLGNMSRGCWISAVQQDNIDISDGKNSAVLDTHFFLCRGTEGQNQCVFFPGTETSEGVQDGKYTVSIQDRGL